MKNIYTPEEASAECLNASIIQMVFSRPRKTGAEQKMRIRKITLDGKDHYHIETFTHNQAFQKNAALEDLQNGLPLYFTQFRTVECSGLTEQLFFLQNNKGKISLTKRIKKQCCPAGEVSCGGHDRIKDYLIPEGEPLAFLIAQGVMSENGAVLKKKYHKFRQMNKFLEFIAGVEPFIRSRTEQSDRPFSIIDFGCGKAYLSFALYHYLHERQGLPVQVQGLDLKTAVVEQCTALAERCGYSGLTFTQGNIADYPLPGGTDMMVCLHACDTATDLALAQAVKQHVPVIFAVPCCQHELYAQLRAHKETFRTHDHLLLPFMEHGIISERFASFLTDTVRALLLQAKGYTVRIMEFIETEHTPKNMLLHAVKKVQPFEQEQKLRRDAWQKYRRIKESFLIEPLLEKLLNI